MNHRSPESALQPANHALLGTVTVLVLTTVHHVYGAYLYDTPWRIHAAFISGLATALSAGSLWFFRRHSTGAGGTFAFWSFVVLTFLVPFLGFGLYEGVYNHGLKDALFFGNASHSWMRRLFPAPMYEMPDDAFFEVTGLMQIAPGLMTGWYLYRLLQVRRRLLELGPAHLSPNSLER